MKKILLLLAALVVHNAAQAQTWKNVAYQSAITNIQPFTGIVLWADNEYSDTYRDAIQLEYSYMKYSDIVKQKGVYDWTVMENTLNDIASRGHQAIIRFYFVYPKDLPDRDGTTTVPQYIKDLPDYSDFEGTGDGGTKCWFPDWRHTELQKFTLDFYVALAQKYDHDKRLAFVQTGFGLWAEYHTWDSKIKIDGKTYKDNQMVGIAFPSKAYQQLFIIHLNTCFEQTPWSISIDAADEDYTPFANVSTLKDMNFGLFDDSFMSEEHDDYNKYNWEFFGMERYKTHPAGGEFNYYTDFDQKNVLNPAGLRGKTWEQWAAQYHISYMIGSDQPYYQPKSRIKEASMAAGYKFRLDELKVSETQTQLTFSNVGIASLYYDAYPEIDGVSSTQSLKGLAPGESRTFTIDVVNSNPQVVISSPHLLSSQVIEFEADITTDIDNNSIEKLISLEGNTITAANYCNIEIYDIQGARIANRKNVNQLDISFLKSGVYMVVAHAGSNTFTLKVVR